VCNVPHNFLCFISTTMFPRSVLTTRETSFHSENASQSFALVKPLFSDMTLYVKNCILRRVRKLSNADVHRFDLSMENFVTNIMSYV